MSNVCQEDKPNPEAQIKKNSDTFELFSKWATILGFINDSVGLLMLVYSTFVLFSSLFVISNKEVQPVFLFTNIIVTPFHLFALWVISAFAFMGICRKDWEKNVSARQYKDNFWQYMLLDIVIGFRNPVISTLIGAFLVSLVWVFVEMVLVSSIFGNIAIGLGLLTFVVGSLIALEYHERKSKRDKIKQDALYTLRKRAKESMDKEWEDWEKRIQEQLRKSWYVSTGCIEDIVSIKRILPDDVDNILSKYAILHPKQVSYSYVYNTSTSEPVFTYGAGKDKMPIKVLISLRKIPTDKYQATSILLASK